MTKFLNIFIILFILYAFFEFEYNTLTSNLLLNLINTYTFGMLEKKGILKNNISQERDKYKW